MRARFHAPDAARADDVVDLPEEEARHLTRVLRLGEGAAIGVFDGRGREFDAVVHAVTRASVQVRLVEERAAPAPEPRVAITLAQAVLKGDKMDDVVRDAVMIGVAAIQPIVTTRAEVTLGALERSRRVSRWARVALSSAKQCGRAVVPPVLEPRAFAELLDPPSIGTAFTLVEPAAGSQAMGIAEIAPRPPGEAALFVGPEGGWTPDELARAGDVTHLVTLGRRTLRADSMALVAVAALFTHWREF